MWAFLIRTNLNYVWNFVHDSPLAIGTRNVDFSILDAFQQLSHLLQNLCFYCYVLCRRFAADTDVRLNLLDPCDQNIDYLSTDNRVLEPCRAVVRLIDRS